MKQVCNCCNNSYDLDDFDLHLVIPKKMKEHGICFQCAFWLKKHQDDVDFQSGFDIENPYMSEKDIMPLIFEGSHWSIPIKNSIIGIYNQPAGPFIRLPYFNHFLRFDGMLISSNNLWHQGEIPERFDDLFPENCVKLTYPQYLEARQILEKSGRKYMTQEQAVKFLKNIL